jgi:hypothetical protein
MRKEPCQASGAVTMNLREVYMGEQWNQGNGGANTAPLRIAHSTILNN